MRTVLLSLGILIAGCGVNTTPTLELSELARDGEKYNGQIVRTCGQLVEDIEYCGIRTRPLPESFPISEIGNFIWIDTQDGTCIPGKRNSTDKSAVKAWVTVEGRFHTGGQYGHMSQARYAMDAFRIEVLDKPCK